MIHTPFQLFFHQAADRGPGGGCGNALSGDPQRLQLLPDLGLAVQEKLGLSGVQVAHQSDELPHMDLFFVPDIR